MDDEYSRRLGEAVINLNQPRFGFYGGIFENGEVNKSRNINTNAVVLEAMLYLKRGGNSFLSLRTPLPLDN